MLLGAPALAQQPPIPPAVVPRPPDTVVPETTPRRLPPLQTPARPALSEAPGVSVLVERFVVSGNTVITSNDIDVVLRPYIGRTLGFAELGGAVDAVTDLYRRRGWMLALAYLPQQKIQGGQIEIAVLEGRLGELRLADSAPNLDRAYLESALGWRLAPGDVVGETNLVRNLLTVNDLPGLALSAVVRPGTGVGTADVLIDVQPYGAQRQGTVVLDNYGSRFTGRARLGASFAAVNLAGRGDQLFVQGLASQDSGQQSSQVGYALPVHASGTRLGASVAAVRYRVIAPELKVLQANGNAGTFQLQADQPLVRSIDYALGARVVLSHKRLNDRIDAVGTRDDRHINAVQAALRGDWRPRGALGIATNWSLAVESGQLRFDDAVAKAADAVQLRTAGNYQRINLDASHEQALSADVSLRLRLAAQAASKNLDAANRVVLGGANSLRPYGDRATSADEAVLVGLTVRWRVPNTALPGLATVAFADYGRGRASRKPDPLAGDNRIQAATLGLGAEMPLPQQMNLRLSVARQKVSPGTDTTPWTNRGWMEWITSF
jgi:hemolysin activation/secretion protein